MAENRLEKLNTEGAIAEGLIPSWFKLKTERRVLIEALEGDSVKKVLLACIDYVETRKAPTNLAPLPSMEQVVFDVFRPDLEAAWGYYLKKINARRSKSNGDGKGNGDIM